jgi:hypothetical protein
MTLALGVASAQGEPKRVLTLLDVIDTAEAQEMRWPVAVAANGSSLAVADAYRPRLLLLQRVGVSWSLQHEVELAAAPAGVARLGGFWVLSLRGIGELRTFGDDGVAGPAIPLPAGFVPGALAAAQADTLLVYDAASSDVVRLSRTGSIGRAVAIDGYVTALAAMGNGGFLAAIADRAALLRFDVNGGLEATWSIPGVGPVPAWPSGIAVDAGGRVLVVDRHGSRVVVLDSQGRWTGLGSRKGWDQGLLLRPSGIARNNSGQVFVADLGNGRVQMFRLLSDTGGS